MDKEQEVNNEWNRIFKNWTDFLESQKIREEDVRSIQENRPDDHTLDEIRYRIMETQADIVDVIEADKQNLIRYDLLGIDHEENDSEHIARIYSETIEEAAEYAKQNYDLDLTKWPQYWLKTNWWYAFIEDEEERLQVR